MLKQFFWFSKCMLLKFSRLISSYFIRGNGTLILPLINYVLPILLFWSYLSGDSVLFFIFSFPKFFKAPSALLFEWFHCMNFQTNQLASVEKGSKISNVLFRYWIKGYASGTNGQRSVEVGGVGVSGFLQLISPLFEISRLYLLASR